ncbi:AAA family ATPase [Prevotellaceae bacterium LKV-178-WT-2A]|uniref:AAA family ATPase n=2 Tax=Prevotellaceae TaxID=171552 RepID=A0A7K0KEF6_9BACT|nr:AAA family ATPase [Hallella mizrahii]
MDERLERISRLNYWQGNHFENGIERKLYLDRIMPFTGNRVIKVMTGQRRAGKSWLMRQIVTELLDRGMAKPHQILYINVIKSIKCVNNYSTFYILPATV